MDQTENQKDKKSANRLLLSLFWLVLIAVLCVTLWNEGVPLFTEGGVWKSIAGGQYVNRFVEDSIQAQKVQFVPPDKGAIATVMILLPPDKDVKGKVTNRRLRIPFREFEAAYKEYIRPIGDRDAIRRYFDQSKANPLDQIWKIAEEKYVISGPLYVFICAIGLLLSVILLGWIHKKGQVPHPIMFSSFWVVLIAVLLFSFWNITMIREIGGDQYTINWTVFIIPCFLILMLAILGKDLGLAKEPESGKGLGLAKQSGSAKDTANWWQWLKQKLQWIVQKGGLLYEIGIFFSLGYPSLGETLKRLNAWHDSEQIERLEKEYKGDPEDLKNKRPFARWMISEITYQYENNAQAMAYVGAAILIALIGLRGIKFIPKNEPTAILLALELEFSLLLLLGMVIFFKPEERKRHGGEEKKNGVNGVEELREAVKKIEEKYKALNVEVEKLKKEELQRVMTDVAEKCRALSVEVERLKQKV